VNSIRKTLIYLLHLLISGLLTIILMVIVTHQLTSEELGQFVLVQAYSVIAVGIANFGMLAGYDRNFFLYEDSKKKSSQLISSALVPVAFSSLILLVLLFWLQEHIFQLLLPDQNFSNIILIVTIGTVAMSMSQYYLTYLKNSGLALQYAKVSIGNSIMYFFIALFLLFVTSLKSFSLAYAWLLSNALLLFLLFYMHRKLFKFSFNRDFASDMLKISLPLTPRVFFGFLHTKFDKIMLGYIGSVDLVGVYHLGQTLALTIFQFMTGLGRVFQPEIYRKLFAEKHKNSSLEIGNYLLPFFYLSIFVAILVALFAKEFVLMFLSEEYRESSLIVVILSIYYASLFFGKVTGAQLIYAKKTNITTLIMLIGILVNVGLNIPLILNWGIVGAAWATTIAGVIMTVAGYFIAQKYVAISWSWRPIFTIYGFFVLATFLAMIDYAFIQHFHISLLIKSFLILLYAFIGYKLNIISVDVIKDVIKGGIANKV